MPVELALVRRAERAAGRAGLGAELAARRAEGARLRASGGTAAEAVPPLGDAG